MAFKYEADKKPAEKKSAVKKPAVKKPAVKKPAVKKAAAKKAAENTAPDVDAYIAGFSPEIRARLAKVRTAIRKAAPQAEESISYRIAAYRLEGTLIYFAGFAHHIGLYPAPRAETEFRDELAAYAGGKGTVQFPHDQALPLDLIKRIVAFRAAENLARAARRKSATAGRAAKSGNKSAMNMASVKRSIRKKR